MKFLIIINGWISGISGGDYHILKVAQHWSGKADILLFAPATAQQTINEIMKTKATLIRTPFSHSKPRRSIVAFTYILRLLTAILQLPKVKVEFVVCSSHFLYDIIPAICMQWRNPSMRIIVYYHGLRVPEESLAMRILRRLNDFIGAMLIARYAYVVFSIHPVVSEYLKKHGVEESRIIPTDNGVDLIRVDEKKEKVLDACFMGRLVSSKGVFDLLEIWKQVTLARPAARLAIIGTGPEVNRMNEFIKRESLNNNISMLGYLSDERFQILQGSRLFLFPSYSEAWPLSIVEAMSCGLPVIAYDIPNLRTVWKDNIFFVPLSDISFFVSSIQKLLADDDLRTVFSKQGLTWSGNHLWEEIADREFNTIVGSSLNE